MTESLIEKTEDIIVLQRRDDLVRVIECLYDNKRVERDVQ